MLIDLLNDKEAALAHQRKVSYMLARTMEMKEDASEKNKENNTLRNRQYKALQSQGSTDLVYTCSQNLSSQNSICPISNTETFENSVKMLRKSYSWPSETMHYEENDSYGKTDETVVISI
nr:PREDICTED: coiled-coil domain-containing protein 125-like [Apteryx mantelli mantelli]